MLNNSFIITDFAILLRTICEDLIEGYKKDHVQILIKFKIEGSVKVEKIRK